MQNPLAQLIPFPTRIGPLNEKELATLSSCLFGQAFFLAKSVFFFVKITFGPCLAKPLEEKNVLLRRIFGRKNILRYRFLKFDQILISAHINCFSPRKALLDKNTSQNKLEFCSLAKRAASLRIWFFHATLSKPCITICNHAHGLPWCNNYWMHIYR